MLLCNYERLLWETIVYLFQYMLFIGTHAFLLLCVDMSLSICTYILVSSQLVSLRWTTIILCTLPPITGGHWLHWTLVPTGHTRQVRLLALVRFLCILRLVLYMYSNPYLFCVGCLKFWQTLVGLGKNWSKLNQDSVQHLKLLYYYMHVVQCCIQCHSPNCSHMIHVCMLYILRQWWWAPPVDGGGVDHWPPLLRLWWWHYLFLRGASSIAQGMAKDQSQRHTLQTLNVSGLPQYNIMSMLSTRISSAHSLYMVLVLSLVTELQYDLTMSCDCILEHYPYIILE